MEAAQATLVVPKARIDTNHLWAFAVTGFFVAISIGAYALNELYIYLVAYLWFGFIYGMCLQGGRFCFSSAFRDLFAVGVPRMVVGIVIACVLFGLTAAFVTATGMSAFHPAPWGIHRMAEVLAYSELQPIASLGSGEVDLLELEATRFAPSRQ